MPWTEITICVMFSLIAAAMFTWVFIRGFLVEKSGKHISTSQTGKLITSSYQLDEQARKRVRRGSIIGFIVLLAIIFACFWSFMVAPAL